MADDEENLPTILWNRRPPSATRERSSDVSSDEGVVGEDRDYFPASRLFEYRWPPDQERAEQYFLQEQVAEFLRIRGIQRKYPDLLRRTVDVPEKKYLMSRGVVTETQSNMGLVAIRSDDVLEIMSDDFPEKYQEYMVVVQEREFQNTLQLRILETRKIALMREQTASGEHVPSVRSSAVREVVEFNKRLALQRRRQHSTFHDRHTQITHVPRKAIRLQSPPRLSRYPVALLPGQYSDYSHRYTSKELFSMPLNTALTLPEKPSGQPDHPVSSSSAPPLLNPDTTTTTLQNTAPPHITHSVTSSTGDLGGDSNSGTCGGISGGSNQSTMGRVSIATRIKLSQSGVVCSVCYRGRASMRQGQPEPLLRCSQCFSNIHPSCLGMSGELASVAMTYPWQCLDCKVCSVCSDPGREEEMVVCDHCDRGYHTFCLKMDSVPEGQWLCMECCVCAKCGSQSGRGDRTLWTHQFIENKFIQTLCVQCSIYAPSVIQQQMLFQQNTMLKAFLAAVASSIAMFSTLYVLPFTRSLFNQVREEFGGCVTAKKMTSFVAGGVILGMGMTLSGACPGMVVVQVGAGAENSLVTLLGCFTGAVLYGALEPTLRRHTTARGHSNQPLWLDQAVGVPYIILAVGVAVATGVIVMTVENIVPWATDSVPVSPSGVGLLAQKSWSPIAAGIVMGCLQLPIALAVHDSLGGSSAYCTIVSQGSWRLTHYLPYFIPFSRGGVSSWWQVLYWAGAAGGAALSSSMAGMWGNSTGVFTYSAFIGGALMLFGARLASGCTSGHGLSGLALLSLTSFVTVPAMFAGGISLAGIMTLV